MQTLSGIAIVTGASGGIGDQLVKSLVEAGMAVYAWDIQPSGSVERPGVIPVEIDVRDREMVERAIADLPEAPALVVNNAAYVHYAPALTLPPEEWSRTIDVNLTGVYWVARSAARRMSDVGRGSLVQIATIAAVRAFPHSVAYAASKAGVIQLTRVLAVELAPYGVRVNAIAPGPIDTPRLALSVTAEGLEARRRAIPLGRFGTPTEVAEVVGFLASDASGYMTGEVLHLDGGMNCAAARVS